MVVPPYRHMDALRILGESLDQICTIETRLSNQARGIIGPLHRAALEQESVPLALAAAQKLLRLAKPGSTVILLTGAYDPLFLPFGETDGPPGAAALARMLALHMQVSPVIVCDGPLVQPVSACLVAAGVGIRSYSDVKKVPYTASVVGIPPEDREMSEIVARLFTEYPPVAVVSVERVGPNRVGVAHGATGKAVATQRARGEYLFTEAKARKILTIGIGDNGNELGFGSIEGVVRSIRPLGDKCLCPCGDGIACSIPADTLVVTNVSNWGAYAIEACLAALLGDPGLMHRPATEVAVLESMLLAGAVDGATGQSSSSVDGTPMETSVSILQLMQTALSNHFRERRRAF